MSEKNDKSTQDSNQLMENEIKDVKGEDAKGLKEEELEQASGGWFPIFDECPGHFEERYCLKTSRGKCPQIFLTERKDTFERGDAQYGSCKKGCFGNQLLYYEADFFFKK